MVKAITRLILLACCLPAFAQESTNFVFFPKRQLAVNEAVPIFQVPVQRLGETNTTLTVEYSVTPGDGAEPDKDFIATQGTLTFAAGETNKTIAISILDDQIAEPTKFINVALTNLTGDAILTNDTATLTLIDNDGRPNAIDSTFGFASTNITAVNDILITPGGVIWFAANGHYQYGALNRDGSFNQIPIYGISNTVKTLALDRQGGIIRGGYDKDQTPVNRIPVVFDEFDFFNAH